MGTAFIFLSISALKGIWPFGNRVLTNGDFSGQAVPVYYHLYDALHGNADLFFDWNFGLGSNFFGIFSHFSIISPFSLFFFFTSRAYLENSMTFFICLKLCSMTLAMVCFLLNDRLFIKKRLPWQLITVFGMGYGLSGFSLLYYGCAYVDIAVFFPLLIFFLDSAIFNNSSDKINKYDLGYMLILSLIMIINITQAFDVCLFVMLYTGLFLVFEGKDNENIGKFSLKFIGLSLVAAGLAAIMLLPSTNELSSSYRVVASNNIGIKGYIAELNDRGMEAEKKYFMLFSLIIPLFISLTCLVKRKLKKILDREDVFLSLITILMIIPVFFETVNHVWHNGSYVCFPMRHGYIMTHMVIFICAALLSKMDDHRYLFSFKESFEEEKALEGFKKREIIIKKLCLLVVPAIWLGFIAFYSYHKITFGEANKAVELSENINKVYEAPKDNSIYRLKNSDLSLDNNYSLILDKPAFGSFMPANSNEQITMDRVLGYAQVWVRMSDQGGTLFTDSLLQMNSVLKDKTKKYPLIPELNDPSIFSKRGEVLNYQIFDRLDQYPQALFVRDLSDKQTTWELEKNTFENQNILSRLLFSKDLFESQDKDLSLEAGAQESVDLKVDKDGYVYIYMPDEFEDLAIYANDICITDKYPRGLLAGVLSLGRYKDETVRITIVNNTEKKQEGSFSLGILDMEAYKDTLKEGNEEGRIKIKTLKSGKSGLDMDINSGEKGYVFVPVNADDGFSIFVNGERKAVETFANTFFLVPVDKGDNHISFVFKPRRLKAGFTLMFFALLLLLGYIAGTFLEERKKSIKICFNGMKKVSSMILVICTFIFLIYAYMIPMLYQLIMWH
ncbi:MAG: YfhO family protein [Lachnospiraceae bacterium]|nr:YfhO family protein [Lachnospiraceae bacterium]